MNTSRRCCAALVALVALAAAAWADPDAVRRAQQLFDAREYYEAQRVLMGLQAGQLSGDDRAAYDRLMSMLPEAINGTQQATSDLWEADRAFAERRFADADRLYRQVASNRFATEIQLAHARTQRQKLAEMENQPPPSIVTAVSPPASTPPPAPVSSDSGFSSSSGSFGSTSSGSSVGVSGTPTVSDGLILTPSVDRMDDSGGGLVDRLRERDELLWQRAEAQMQSAARRAREAVQARRYAEAKQAAAEAGEVIEAAKRYAQPPSRYEEAKASALALQKEIEDAIAQANITEAERQAIEIAEQSQARASQIERLKAEKVDQLFRTADQLSQERRFREAAEATRQIVSLDPTNPTARKLLTVYDDLASLEEQLELDTMFRRQSRGVFVDSREALVPWYQEILYPRNWPEISARRDGVDSGFRNIADNELNRLIDQTETPEGFSFDDAPLSEVIDAFGASLESNLMVDWDDLAQIGVERDRPVSLNLRSPVPFRTALKTLLRQIGGDGKLDFVIADGVISIASREKLDQDKQTLVYDVRDLLINIPRFKAPVIQNADALNAQLAGTDSLFDMDPPRSEDTEPREDQQTQDPAIARKLLDLIRSTVNPESWRENGGDGAIRELNGQVIVYGTSDTQRQTQNLLEQLRAARALQISVESRFLIVTSNFLEEIGVDLDFVFNQGEAGFDRAFGPNGPIVDNFTGAPALIPRDFSRAGVLPALPAGGVPITQGTVFQPYGNAAFVPQAGGVVPGFNQMTAIPVQSGSIGYVAPNQINTGVPNSFGGVTQNPALSIAGSFLDNLQIDFLVRATQANRRSSVVQAPKLMMFNGQRAFVAIQRQQSYVASVTPAVAEGAVGVTPVIQGIAAGTSLDVEGTISADRKYVTLTVRTQLADAPTFTSFETQRSSGNSPGIFVLLPDQQTRSISTTVSVPDGGTVLLGGLKQVGEIEVEAGVPVLSKIPVLKRAFTNRTMVKDTQTLLILLKAKILIQREAEEEVFPSLLTAR